jgi:hypothetical protein
MSNKISILIIALLIMAIINASTIQKDNKVSLCAMVVLISILLIMSQYSFMPSDSIDPYKNTLMSMGQFLKGNPKVDGCCLFPESEVCKQYTSEEISQGCCNKGLGGKRVRFTSEEDQNTGCTKCRRQGEIL